MTQAACGTCGGERSLIIAGGPYTQANCRMIVMLANMALNAWGEDAFSAVAHAYVAKQHA